MSEDSLSNLVAKVKAGITKRHILYRDLIYDVADGKYPRREAIDVAMLITHGREPEFAKALQWLAVLSQRFGKDIARKFVDEIFNQ